MATASASGLLTVMRMRVARHPRQETNKTAAPSWLRIGSQSASVVTVAAIDIAIISRAREAKRRGYRNHAVTATQFSIRFTEGTHASNTSGTARAA